MVVRGLLLLLLGLNWATAAAFELHHVHGVLQLKAPPQRLAVYHLGTLDSLQQLGIAVAGAPRLRYLPRFAQIPARDIGSLHQANIEALLDLAPDLIVLGDQSAQQYAQISKLAPCVDLSSRIDNGQMLQQALANMWQFARLYKREAQAEQLEARIHRKIKRARALVAAKNFKKGMAVLLLGQKILLLDSNSFAGWIIAELGLQTVHSAQKIDKLINFAPISFEYIVAHKPDWLLVLDRDAAIGSASSARAAQVFDNALINTSYAAKKRRIIYLDNQEALLATGVGGMERTLDNLIAALKELD